MVELENEIVSIIILPELGGKVVSIKSLTTGQEFLTQSANSSNVEKPEYGQSFLPPHAFGFDECFPTISESTVKMADRLITYPDHGELWTANFNCRVFKDENKCILDIRGVNFDFSFRKEITLRPRGLSIVYNIENHSQEEFEYLWSAHPLLSIEYGDEILLPEGVKNVRVDYASNSEWGKDDLLDWPIPYKDTSLNYVQKPWCDIALKVFAQNLSTGKAGLYRASSDETLQFKFDTYRVDCLGIWICYGGWPEKGSEKDYTVALEPTNCAVDSLEEAIDKGLSKKLMPGENISWFLDITIEQGRASNS